ncbi:hypothetical protein EDD11_006291 [Mortierella claussenii]|nr:hypothetical protein EDD11_006291 [Mortierella claussenii]
MIFTWTLFFVNLILAIIRFLVIASIGAALALYSRQRGEHANSIRWVRQGGYLEMLNFLINTRNDITKQAKAVLLLTVLATVASTIIGRGAVRYIEPTVRSTNQSSVLVNTKQYVPLTQQRTFSGWSRSIRNASTIIETMTAMISDTNNIPNAVSGRTYIPRTSRFEAECNKLDVSFMGTSSSNLLRNDGCANLLYKLNGVAFAEDPAALRIRKRSGGRWSVTVAADTNYLSFDFRNHQHHNIEAAGNQSNNIGDSWGPIPPPPPLSVAMEISYLRATGTAYPALFSLSDIKDATATAAQYFALLGQSCFTDWHSGQLVVLYDTTDAENGLETPFWLIICVPMLAVSV